MAATSRLGLILSPLRMQVGPGCNVVIIRNLLSDQFQILIFFLLIGCVKSQLLCSFRIELAVGYLTYPRLVLVERVKKPLDEQLNPIYGTLAL